MPIEIECPRCRRKFRVPDRYAGKRVKCPECEGPIGIPAAGQPAPKEPVRSAEAVPEQAGPDRPTAQRWYLRTEEGQQFGPASREELDDWLAEGRIDASCQVLCEGWKQWKWADEVFPELAEDSTETQQAAAAGEESPFAGIGDAVGPGQKEINPFVSPQEPAGGIDVAAASEHGSAITPRMRRALAQTRPWVMLLAIVGLAGAVLWGALATLGLVIALVNGGWKPVAANLAVFVVSVIIFVSYYYLLSYGRETGSFLVTGKEQKLENALMAQRSFFRLMGIVALIGLIAPIVGFIVVVILFAVGALP